MVDLTQQYGKIAPYAERRRGYLENQILFDISFGLSGEAYVRLDRVAEGLMKAAMDCMEEKDGAHPDLALHALYVAQKIAPGENQKFGLPALPEGLAQEVAEQNHPLYCRVVGEHARRGTVTIQGETIQLDPAKSLAFEQEDTFPFTPETQGSNRGILRVAGMGVRPGAGF